MDVWNLENFSIKKKSLLFSRSSRRATQIKSGTLEDEESWFSPNNEQDMSSEAKLDRFYISEQFSRTTLSDHMPVILRLEELA